MSAQVAIIHGDDEDDDLSSSHRAELPQEWTGGICLVRKVDLGCRLTGYVVHLVDRGSPSHNFPAHVRV